MHGVRDQFSANVRAIAELAGNGPVARSGPNQDARRAGQKLVEESEGLARSRWRIEYAWFGNDSH
jgi:hypothetical protein